MAQEIKIPRGMKLNQRTRRLLNRLEFSGQIVLWDGNDSTDDYETLEQMIKIMNGGRVIRLDMTSVCQMNPHNLSVGRFAAIWE